MSARARNALRRPGFIVVVGGMAFIAALVAMILTPKPSNRSVQSTLTSIPRERLDSTRASDIRNAAAYKIKVADSIIDLGRRAAAIPPAPVDTLPPQLRPVRDSLQGLVNTLSALISRAQNAPLPSSYRALGESPILAGNPAIPAKLDTLAAIEKERAAFGTVGGADPVYVALTTRANAVGRDIIAVAQNQIAQLRAQMAPLMPVVIPRVLPIAVDTLRQIGERAAAERTFLEANRQLDSIREINAQIDFEERRSRDIANRGAPPLAMLGAALVLALVLGFGTAVFLEVRHPKISDSYDAEHVANTRVLAVIEPKEEIVERSRRQADVEGPPLIDVISESYRTLYLHLAATEQNVPVVTVTGDEPLIVATVAANLAATSAYEARSTLLVDVDPTTNAVAGVLRISANPGLAGIISESATWPEAIVSTTIGRDRPLDVLPGGMRNTGQINARVAEQIREEFGKMERRYDLIVLAAPTSYVQRGATSIIPAPDVVLCGHVAHTSLKDLRSSVESLRGAGMTVHGLVLWDDTLPVV